MKKFLLLNALIISLFSCKAQTPVIPIYGEGVGNIPNAYYKDVDNDFNKFVGTWKYQSGTDILIIEFRKRTMHFDTKFNIYLDMLVGEYQFIQGGIEKANTLTDLSNSNLNLFDNTISGALIKRPCNTCPANEREVSLYYSEPSRPYLEQKFEINHYVQSGNEYIKIDHYGRFATIPAGVPAKSTLPVGIYILKKQP